MKSSWYRLVPAVIVLVTACGSQSPTVPETPPAPTGGWLTIQLTTPHTNDGAVQFSVSGPAIDSVALVGYDGYAVIANGAADLIVTGAVVAGDVARVYVSNLTQYGLYAASIAAAAARGTYQLQVLDGYRATLVR